MKNSKFVIDKLAKLFEQGLISSKDIAAEIMAILKSKRDEIVFKMKLTTKDEMDVISKRIDKLEKNRVCRTRSFERSGMLFVSSFLIFFFLTTAIKKLLT